MWIVIAIVSLLAIGVGGYGLHKVKKAADYQPSGMMGLFVPLVVWGALTVGGIATLSVSIDVWVF